MAIINGTSGGDTLNGTSGDDTITGGAGNDTITGGDGTDRAVFSGAVADYLILYDADSGTYTVTDRNAGDGDDGTDVLTGIETLEFSDATVDLTGTPPLATDSVVQVPEDGLASHLLTGSGGADGPDSGTDVTLTYELIGLTASTDGGHPSGAGWYETAHGYVRITDAATGEYEYDPSTSYAGADSFDFRVTDELGVSSEATVAVDVGAFDIDKAVNLNGADEYLSITHSGAPDSDTTWTVSAWIQRDSIGSYQRLFSDDTATSFLQLSTQGTNDKLEVQTAGGLFQSTEELSSTNGWYHILVSVDTTAATASDRIKVYVNGDSLTNTSMTHPAQNASSTWGSADDHFIGKNGTGHPNPMYFDGKIADFVSVDGEALVPGDFGYEDGNGEWVPKNSASIDVGTNGFHLNFGDSSDLGADVSGNGNDFSLTNLGSENAYYAPVETAVDLNGSDEYFVMTPGGTQSSDTTWTISTWVQRDSSGNYQRLFSDDTSSTFLQFSTNGSNDKLEVQTAGGLFQSTLDLDSLAIPDNWAHVVIAVDTTESTAADRIKVYFNGTELSSTSTTHPSLNATSSWGAPDELYIGRNGTQSGQPYYFDGKIANFAYIDGQALDYSSFREQDAEGNWVAKDLSGLSFGNNGFLLDFTDPNDFGNDVSGNDNDFTPTNINSANDYIPSLRLSSLIGTSGNDYLEGESSADVLSGLAGDDMLIGGAGDDTLIGGAGNDIIDGGDDTDTAVFSGAISDYLILHDADTDSFTVIDTAPGTNGDDGTDVVTNVENLEFSDASVDVTTSLPLATDSIVQIPEDGLAEHNLTGAGGTDEDGLNGVELIYKLVDGSGNAVAEDTWLDTANGRVKITDDATGAYVFEPDEGYSGADGFTYRVTDERGISSQATVGVNVGSFEIDRAIDLNGTDESLVFTPVGSPTSNAAWTISAWVQRDSSGNYQRLFSDDTSSTFLQFSTNGSNDKLEVQTGGGLFQSSEELDSLVPLNQWFNLVVSFDGTEAAADRIQVYVDGEALTNTSVTHPGTTSSWGSVDEHYIGRNGTQSGQSYHFDGQIADFASIDGAALNPDAFGFADAENNWVPKDVSGLTMGNNGYHLDFADAADLGNDVSGNGNDFTPTNVDSSNAYFAPIDRGVDLNGSDESLVFTPGGSPDSSSAWTISTWVSRDSNGSYQRLFSDDTSSTFLQFSTNGSNDKLEVQTGGGLFQSSEELDSLVPLNQWFNLVVSFDGSASAANRIQVFVDGTALSNTSGSHPGTTSSWGSVDEHYIGRNGTQSGQPYHFDGKVADFFSIDGQALDAGDFGYENADGDWVPKNTTGIDVGSNGYHLDFAAAGDLGNDVSGNGNDFTLTNIDSSNAYEAKPPTPPVEVNPTDGNDVLAGGSGVDVFNGGDGDDLLIGGLGNDYLAGGAGQDVLEGGVGADVFIYTAVADSTDDAMRDVINDFDAGTGTTAVDSIDISAIVTGTFDFLGADTESFTDSGNTEARFNNSTKILEIDADGDAEVDMEIELKDVDIANLDDSDFTVS